MSSNSNVVAFPNKKKNGGTPGKNISLQEINDGLESMRMYHVQEAVTTIIPVIFNSLDVAGFHMFGDEEGSITVKEGAFIVESLRSMLLKYYGIAHPFQILAENVFTPDKDNDEILTIVQDLNVSLKKE